MLKASDHLVQIELAKNLLKNTRHAAYATTNPDGTPHNSPLMLMYNEDLTRLYIGTYSESLHTKNLVRTGQAFAVLFDSFTPGKGGVYIAGSNARECQGDELAEALRVHNNFRARYGNRPLELNYYQSAKPSQRMYSIDVSGIEIYSAIHDENGLIVSESRVKIKARVLLEGAA